MKKIYILHGWAYSTEKWRPFIEELNKKFDVEMLKVPGLTAKLNRVWELDDYVEWLKKIIGKEKVILLGHSNGGRTALAFASQYPEKVEKLILIDSAGIYHNELPIRLKRLVFGVIAKTGKKFTNSIRMRQLLYKFAREKNYEEVGPIVRGTMANLLHSDITNKLSSVKVPTVIIWGEQDKITPLSDAEIMHNEIKNSKLHIISGARHSPMFTHIKETAAIVTENL